VRSYRVASDWLLDNMACTGGISARSVFRKKIWRIREGASSIHSTLPTGELLFDVAPFFYRRVTNVGVYLSSDLGKRLAVVITNFQDIGIGDDQLRLGRNLNLLNSLSSCLLITSIT
jgi:hypothetical protein